MPVSPEARKLTRQLLQVIGNRSGTDAALALTIALGAILNQAPTDRAGREALARKVFDVLIDMINQKVEH